MRESNVLVGTTVLGPPTITMYVSLYRPIYVIDPRIYHPSIYLLSSIYLSIYSLYIDISTYIYNLYL